MQILLGRDNYLMIFLGVFFMNLVKRMGFSVLYALCAFMVFQADAMVKTYGKKPKSNLTGSFELQKKRNLDFKRSAGDDYARPKKRQKTAKDENQTSTEKPMTDSDWQTISKRVKSADNYQLEEVLTNPALENKILYDAYKRERQANGEDDLFFANLYASDKRESEKRMLQKYARDQEERQAELARKQQEERSKKSEQDRMDIVQKNTRIVQREEKQRQQRRKERDADVKPQVFKSQYSQNFYDQSVTDGAHNRGRHDTVQNALNQVYSSIAEGDYGKVYEQINGKFSKELSNVELIRILGLIGSEQGIGENPEKLYKKLCSQNVGVLFPQQKLTECALHFAEKAGNELYLEFAQS
jgi:hypothetical protein